MSARHALTFLALAAWCAPTAAQSHEVPPALWDRPRSAAAVSADESVRQAALVLLASPDARLTIRHAGGQEPQLHAEELRSWLGALAIDPRRVTLSGDLAAGAPLRLEVTP